MGDANMFHLPVFPELAAHAGFDLQEAADSLIDSLPEDISTALEQSIHLSTWRSTVKIATICSGTDNLCWCLAALQTSLFKRFAIYVNLVHEFSCDVCPHARVFIGRNHAPKYIFGDVKELSKPMAFDYLTKKMVHLLSHRDRCSRWCFDCSFMVCLLALGGA